MVGDDIYGRDDAGALLVGIDRGVVPVAFSPEHAHRRYPGQTKPTTLPETSATFSSMQSDTPQSDPRLQRINPTAKVATAYVDPCIVYLETTAPGEIPVLGIGWATSSREVREADGASHLELSDVGLVKGVYEKPLGARKAKWTFSLRNVDRLILKHEQNDALSITDTFLTCRFKDPKVIIPQWKIRFLTPEVATILQKLLLTEGSTTPTVAALILLEHSNLDWPSVLDAIASFKRNPKLPVRRRTSLVRRLISSVFKKKPQPVHV